MSKYGVEAHRSLVVEFEVEADSIEEARKAAAELVLDFYTISDWDDCEDDFEIYEQSR